MFAVHAERRLNPHTAGVSKSRHHNFQRLLIHAGSFNVPPAGPYAQEDEGRTGQFAEAHVFTEEEVGENGGEHGLQGEDEACSFRGGVLLGHRLDGKAVGGREDSEPQNGGPFGKGMGQSGRFQKKSDGTGYDSGKAHLP